MTDLPALADPERALALAYAPAAAREALRVLFALDERLASIVISTREPALAAIKLAWWRDALTRLDAAPAPAEPLLAAVAGFILPRGVSGARLADLEEGWLVLLDGTGAEPMARHAADRGSLLFEIAATILGGADPRIAAAGAGWALVDRARAEADSAAQGKMLAAARTMLAPLGGSRWPSRLRALGVLAVLARRDATRGRLSQLGSPARVIRAVAHGISGY